MSSECDKNPLCDLAKTKFCEMEKRWSIEMQALQTAIAKSESLLAIRLEEMNNFRRQMTEERAAYMTRRESVLINLLVSILVVSFGVFITYILTK